MKKASEGQPNYLLKDLRLLRNWTQADVAEKINTTSLNVSRWERGLLIPSLHFRQKLCDLFDKSIEELGLFRGEEHSNHTFQMGESMPVQNASALSLADSPYYWHVSYQRNPFFTGREEDLHSLHELLGMKQTEAVTHLYALSGPGGIGKTQTALEYIYRYASEYDAIFWIEANSKENILAGFSTIFDILNLPKQDAQTQNNIVSRVKLWLHTHKNWFLIFDDVEDTEMVKGFLPTTRNGALLLTTQRATLGNIALPIMLEPLCLEDATLLLLHRARILEQKSSLCEITPDDALIARTIAESMEVLPLALDQAGAYIDENKCSLAEFLYLFQEYPLQLLGERGFCTDHPHSVMQTVSYAFERLQQKNPAAAELLTLCCFLDLDAIPEALFLQHASHPLLHQLISDALQFNLLLKELLSFSLIHRNRETRLLMIQPLAAIVLKGQLDECTRRRWADRAIKIAHQNFPVAKIEGSKLAFFAGASLALSS